jgi:hypothetical protein
MRTRLRQLSLGLAFVFALALINQAEAKTIHFGGEAEVVPIVAGEPTLFRFPSEVKTISRASRYGIAPANPDEPNYAFLEVRPRFSTGSGEVVFVLSDGTIVKTKIVVVPKAIPERTDSIYEFKSKESLLTQGGGPDAAPKMTDLELMKALLRNDQVAGYEAKSLTRTLSPGFKGVTTRLIRIYSGNLYNGYIFEIENTSKGKRLFLNVPNLVLGDPNVAILSSADDYVLEAPGVAGSKTYLRIVAKATSLYNQLILPIQVVEKR